MLDLLAETLKRVWRILATGFSFILFAVGAILVAVLGIIFILPLPIPKFRKQLWFRNLLRIGCSFFVYVVQLLGLLSLSTRRQVGSPVSGHIIVANHPTLLDAVILIAEFGNICCIVKQTLKKHPITALPVSLAGYIPNSSEDILELAKAKLGAGENILIFPEGTRSDKSEVVSRFKRGAANIAINSDSPILPVTIWCLPRTLAKQEKWYQVPISPPRFVVTIGSPILVADSIDVERPRTVQYRHLTRFLSDHYDRALEDANCFIGD